MFGRPYIALWPLAGMFLGFALSAQTGPASGHPASDFYPETWLLNTTEHWLIDDGVPTGDFRDSVKFGIGQWDNGAGGQGPDFVFDGEVTSNSGDFNSCNGETRSVVFVKEDLGLLLGLPGALGWVDYCVEGPPPAQAIGKFEMYLEKTPGVGWYVGSGTPPSNRYDLRSIVTHETGHTTGWVGHFTGSTLCDSGDMATFHTMCTPAAPPGTIGMRYLEAHDVHTYGNAY